MRYKGWLLVNRKRKAAVLGLLSAGALALSTGSASADTYQFPGQIGALGSGCWGNYTVTPYSAGHHVTGFIYSQQPNGPRCELYVQQFVEDSSSVGYTADYVAWSPGDSVSSSPLYYGPSPVGHLCVRINWSIPLSTTVPATFC